jgi:DmsE family decaheme c-type cytochrome
MREHPRRYFSMQGLWPRFDLPIGAVRVKSPGLRVCLLLILGAGLVFVPALGAATPGAKPANPPHPNAAAQQKDAAPGDFVGADVCATCHTDEANKFGENPHSKLAEQHGKSRATCESCHGAGRAHVESGGDKSKIFNPAKGTPKEVDAKCLGCHQGEHSNFERSAHGEANVSCVGCHSVHAGEDKEHLLKLEQPKLCFTCHTDVKPQFAMPFHHKVEEGLMKCSDCHDPHGTFEKKNLRSSAQQDAVCTKCHAETAGPFVYEHNVVKTEGCVACHFPHGGPNPRLLNRANVNTLCLQCHSPSPNFTTGAMPTFHNQAVQYQACTICHTSIHGSNTSKIFFNSTE